jgi:hypothetical protein
LRGINMNFRRLVFLGFCLVWISARAAQLAVGDAVPTFSAKDQHGKEFNLTNGVKFLLVATEMACAKSANQKLAEQGAGFLEKHQAAYVLDIHSMPSIARVFALPKMRKYPQRIVLVETAETLAAFPVQPGRVTVLALTSAGRVRKISYWDPAREPVAGCLQ